MLDVKVMLKCLDIIRELEKNRSPSTYIAKQRPDPQMLSTLVGLPGIPQDRVTDMDALAVMVCSMGAHDALVAWSAICTQRLATYPTTVDEVYNVAWLHQVQYDQADVYRLCLLASEYYEGTPVTKEIRALLLTLWILCIHIGGANGDTVKDLYVPNALAIVVASTTEDTVRKEDMQRELAMINALR